MRVVMTRVFPVPAPASTSRGPSVVSTASRCAGFRVETRELPGARRRAADDRIFNNVPTGRFPKNGVYRAEASGEGGGLISREEKYDSRICASKRRWALLRRAGFDLERIAVVAVAEVEPEVGEEKPEETVSLPLLDVGLLVADHPLLEMARASENVRAERDGDIPLGKKKPRDPRAVVNHHDWSIARRV